MVMGENTNKRDLLYVRYHLTKRSPMPTQNRSFNCENACGKTIAKNWLLANKIN